MDAFVDIDIDLAGLDTGYDEETPIAIYQDEAQLLALLTGEVERKP